MQKDPALCRKPKKLRNLGLVLEMKALSGVMKKRKSPRRTVTSSLNMCPLINWGNRVVVKGRRRYYSFRLNPCLQQSFVQILSDDLTVYNPPQLFPSRLEASPGGQ
jgi:hypothetical protein